QDPQLVAMLRGKFFPAEAQVRSVGTPQAFQTANGTGYLHRLDAVSQGIGLRVQIYVAGLPGGGVAGVLAIGRPALVAHREAIIATVAASLSRHAASAPVNATALNAPVNAAPVKPVEAAAAGTNGPLSAQWDKRLRGRKLYQFSSYSSGYGSGGYN